ncbi:MAG: hypothetical protein K2Y22_11250 [Candidatus Obscuribacterales bacterium]|nr:hypothetical protein [Candidatus Obscuribacterales bacterium]
MFERFGPEALAIIEDAKVESQRHKAGYVNTTHLLMALTNAGAEIACQALNSVNVTYDSIGREAAKLTVKRGAEVVSVFPQRSSASYTEGSIGFSEAAAEVLHGARDQSRYFGQSSVNPEHILLAITESKQASAMKILEELGANITFLRRQVMSLMAHEVFASDTAPLLRTTLIDGLTDVISHNLQASDSLRKLSQRAAGKEKTHRNGLPDDNEIVHMALVSYIPDFLYTQVTFQRYLLQKSIHCLTERTGPLDQELSASIISSAAQNLRKEVRETIEYLWSHEYRIFTQVLDDAEHDLIGSVIEDLWWTESEELALEELFDNALEDHRRKQVLSLQKRRLELAQRLNRLRERLESTIHQSFQKRKATA